MNYELFTQDGFHTYLKSRGGKSDVFSNDYTGKSVRECGTDKKKMVSVSSNNNIPINKLIKCLQDTDHEIHIADIQSLSRLKRPKIEADLKAVLDECKQTLADDVTFNLAHAKYTASIELLGTDTSFSKEHEHVCALIEDSKNLDVVYVLNISRNNLHELPRMIKQVMDWFSVQRKLTRRVSDGVYTVVLSKEACGTLYHEVVGHTFELSQSYTIHSPTKYPDGFQLFSDKITVYDKPFALTMPHEYDDEGTKCGQTKLIENGCIVSPMTDKRSIISFPKYSLTGNARRESFLNYPATRFYRISAEKGTSSFQQAVGDVEHGIYIDHVSAARCYHLEDRVTLRASRAYMIRNGVVTDEPVSCVVDDKISSFFFPVHVCDEIGISPGFCNSTAGYMYVEHEAPVMSFDNIKVKDVFVYET